jgi:HEAT repeat protein
LLVDGRMTQSSRSALEQEVERLRSWAEAYDRPRRGEWECDYTSWADLYNAVTAYVSDSKIEEWDEVVAALLLYAIARDNELEHIAGHLRKTPEKLYALAQAAVRSGEKDAKWQMAKQLAHCPDQEGTEALLLVLATDPEEYVRRRALMALGRIKSSHVEILVEQAWDSGDEYQRMAVLDALHSVQSKKLAVYLDMAQADARQYLMAFANQIRRGEVPFR